MNKYEELYKVREEAKVVTPIKLFLTGLSVAVAVILLINAPRFVGSLINEKVYIGDYNLEYVGKYVTATGGSSLSLYGDFNLVYRVVGSNGVSEVVVLEVERKAYNTANADTSWKGVASIYESDKDERTSYFRIQDEDFSVVKYDVNTVVKDYWGGSWADTLYQPIFHDGTYEVEEVM